MKMKRNCNLELCLFPSHDSGDSHHHQHYPMVREGKNKIDEREMSGEDEEHQQKLTIFYDGKVCVSDVTHLQARWIMKEASKEMAEEENKNMELKRSLRQSHEREMCSPNNNNNHNNNNTSSLSMKRSLQRFLQKRKDRILHSSPYHP